MQGMEKQGGKGHASGMLRDTRVKPGAFLPEEVPGVQHTSPAVWTRGGVKEWLSEVKEGKINRIGRGGCVLLIGFFVIN